MTDIDRQRMDVDIVCVGFGPASGGFLTTLQRAMADPPTAPSLQSRVAPGLPLQVLCYERAEDVAFGVSGVVTRGRGIRASYSDSELEQIPMAHPVTGEKLVYLRDPIGASRRTRPVKALDAAVAGLGMLRGGGDHAVELPYVPEFMSKADGLVMSIGQFNGWVAAQLMAGGLVQVWPGMPVAGPLFDEDDAVVGVRLADQGLDRAGNPTDGFMPGMDIGAALTVVGDGPVGPIGRALDARYGLPTGHEQREWAVGMKMVVELPESCRLEPGAVLHTVGYPEPEIFGFLYVYPDRSASVGIFVPSWFDSPVRTSYRYLQHWMRHPYIWRHLAGGRMRSWGAKTLHESGRRGEPHLVGDGYARIGEGSGSTNVLTGSGVDEAWTTGVLLAEAVIELLAADRPFTRRALEETYVRRRRDSWLEREARIAERARDGFQRGFVSGLVGMGLTGLSRGRLNLSPPRAGNGGHTPAIEEYYEGVLSRDEIARARAECATAGTPLHDALMTAAGWPSVEYDGKLLVSHQDALLIGGKVQAPAGYPDHVVFLYPSICERCETKLCIEICSGQAITPGENGVPQFDREKCVHCGACMWSCTQPHPDDAERGVIELRAGAGGLHSVEN